MTDPITEPEVVDDTVEETTDDTVAEAAPETTDVDDDADVFPREYVQRLRDESARYRQRASRADDLAERLHVALVAATGRLADPTDLAFDEAHLDDAEALSSAIGELLKAKPHLASRKPTGDVGQGAKPDTRTVSLAGLLRSSA
jgi:hypothetical protein